MITIIPNLIFLFGSIQTHASTVQLALDILDIFVHFILFDKFLTSYLLPFCKITYFYRTMNYLFVFNDSGISCFLNLEIMSIKFSR